MANLTCLVCRNGYRGDPYAYLVCDDCFKDIEPDGPIDNFNSQEAERNGTTEELKHNLEQVGE